MVAGLCWGGLNQNAFICCADGGFFTPHFPCISYVDADFMGHKKALFVFDKKGFLVGRDGEIRTHDPLHPMQVRYLAALHPEMFVDKSTQVNYAWERVSLRKGTAKLMKYF